MIAGVPLAHLVAVVLAALTPHAAAPAGSPFAWRGVVEGQYGRPWDHAQRVRVLRFMAREGWNAYVHAPKDDRWQRALWRRPYPRAVQGRFDREVRFARRRGIDWVPNLSPGTPLIPTPGGGPRSRPICFSCRSEVGVLVRKLGPFLRAGSRTFMLSFDDVRVGLSDPRDLAAYGAGPEAFGRANGDLLTRLLRALRRRARSARLLTVGANYAGTADSPYLRGLRRTLAHGIEVMWTGPSILSKPFSAAQARAYGRRVGRRPVVWDNWTVNDAEGNITGHANRIHLGPWLRDARVVGSVRGFFLNPMNEADLNLLPFATAADFFAAPHRYRPRRSWLRRVAQLGGPARAELRAFAEVNYSSPLDPGDEAPTFTRRARGFLRAYGAGGGWPPARRRLAVELSLVRRAPAALRRVPGLRSLAREARPFLASAARGARAADAAAALLAAERPTLELHAVRGGFAGHASAPSTRAVAARRRALARAERAVRADPRNTFGYRGRVLDIPSGSIPPNRLDALLARVRRLDGRYSPPRGAALVVTLDGRRLRLGLGGALRLPTSAAGRLLAARDGDGGRTAIRIG
jgi:hyaluronoglucosaminidase